METIVIPLSKTKIALRAGGSVLFVLLGYFLLTTVGAEKTGIWAAFVKGTGVACMLFFGATTVYAVKKMFDKNAGLIIDNQGITDNTHASSIGLIKWEDITEIRMAQVMSSRFLLIYMPNYTAILEKYTGIRRKIMEQNMKTYGTPVSITTDTLNCQLDDLVKLIGEKMTEAKKPKGTR